MANRRPIEQQSTLTTGSDLLPGVHASSAWGRRWLDLIHLHAGDLGGWDFINEAERSVLRRIATLTIKLERLEIRDAQNACDPEFDDIEGQRKDDDLYNRGTANLRRLLESVGLDPKSRARTVEARMSPTHDLTAYLTRTHGDKPNDS